ncbi:oxidoreductase [Streptomyces triticagri]|uniref:Oxidoreductase n=1 Tax=Streptomyces triticagri TaxID=2293568 RepID=A0A372M8C9_9ACTN|nr:oxidoreductase [Streptomyces triticagri]RFU87204.1 oxidoreductase [Streptomyces triticagri]
MKAEGKTRRGRRLWTLGMCAALAVTVLSASAQAQQGPTALRGTAGGADSPGAYGSASAVAAAKPTWRPTPAGTDVRFRGLAAVGRKAAWVAGAEGTVLRTSDGGRSWRDVSPPGASGLEFRDVEAFDTRRAVVLAIGEGDASRVLRTDDGGATWTETFRNDEPGAFYNCVSFFDRRNGLAVSDPVDGRFRILATSDGGRSWRVLPDSGMPDALPGEAGFAASGQCLVTAGARDAWLSTGGGDHARVLHSRDRGRTWEAAAATIPAGDPARGVFGLAFRDRHHGLAVGGDFTPELPSPHAAAVTGDGGRSWRPSDQPPPAYRSGVAWLPHSRSAALAVGPTGTDLTRDGGRTWETVDTGSYDTVDCTRAGTCWAAGEQGRIAVLARR